MGRLKDMHPVDFMINMMPGPLKPFTTLEKVGVWALYSIWGGMIALALYQGLTA